MFDKNLILPDSAFTEYRPFGTEAFLKEVGSPLADYSLDGKLVSSHVDEVCRKQRLDLRFLLTKLQVEQSLLFQHPTQEKLDWALGYGCPDSGPRREEYRGFPKQIEAAALGIKSYLTPGHPLYVGELVAKEWKVGDGAVTCRNLATAALYRYTPWIGENDFGSHRAPFGNFLFYKVWTGLFGPVSFEEPSPATKTWSIIAPPDNWRAPLSITEEELPRFEQLAASLQLVMSKDEERRKLYLGTRGPSAPSASFGTLTFPSGKAFPIVDGTPWKKKGSTYWPPHEALAPPLIHATPENLKKKLSKHFTLEEFLCLDRSYDLIRISPKLIEKLEKIREAAGGHPVHITSAYRPYPYNATIRGADPKSFHIDGLAADLSINEVPVARLGALTDTVIGGTGGVGIYYAEEFVHVDVSGTRRRW